MSTELPIAETPTPAAGERNVTGAMLRGAAAACPACGKAPLYRAFLKVHESCPACGEALHHQRADDAPAYFTMVIVAHVVVGGLLALEQALAPPTWVQLAIWLPLTAILSLLLLPRVKGALIGLQWALRMHGFGGSAQEPRPEPDPAAGVPHPAGQGKLP